MSKDTAFDVLTRLDPQTAAAALSPRPWEGLQTRATDAQTALTQERDERIAALHQSRDRILQEENSLAGRMGLDRDSNAHALVNRTAALTSAAARTAGTIAAAPFDAYSMLQEAQVPVEAEEAYARNLNNVATAEDLQLLGDTNNASRVSYQERLQSAANARSTADKVSETMDWTSLVDPRARLQLSQDLAAGGKAGLDKLKNISSTWEESKIDAVVDLVSGISDLAANASASMMANPGAFMEYVTEMLPDLAVGMISKPALFAVNVGYGLDAYREGVKNYAAENDGALPPEELRQYMMLNAMGAAVAEMFGDMNILKAGTKAAGAATDTAEKVSLLRRARTVGGEAVEGYAGEAATEAAVTYFEGEASLRPATAEQLYESAAIGGHVGGALTAGLSAVNQLGGAARDAVKSSAAKSLIAEKSAEEKKLAEEASKAAVTTAKETGDVTELVNRENTDVYNPVAAALALRERATNQELPEAERTAAKETLGNLVSTLEADLKEANNRSDMYEPEQIAKLQELSTAYTKELDSYDKDSPEHKQISDMLVKWDAMIKEATTNGVAGKKQAQDDITKIEAELRQVSTEYSSLKSVVTTVTPENVAETVAKAIVDEDTPERTEATTKAFTLLMESPDSFDDETLQSMVSANNTGFTDAQLDYLDQVIVNRREGAELEGMQKVHGDIMFGKGNQRGISKYRERFAEEMSENNLQGAARVVLSLRRFQDRHQTKLAKIENDLKEAQEIEATGKKVKGKYTSKQISTLAAIVAREVAFMDKNAKELETALRLKAGIKAPLDNAVPDNLTNGLPPVGGAKVVTPPAQTTAAPVDNTDAELGELIRANAAKAEAEAASRVKRKQSAKKAQETRRTPNNKRDTLINLITKLGGISLEDREESGGDPTTNVRLPTVGSLFNATGKSIDALAELLNEAGFIPPEAMADDGGVQWVKDKVKAGINGTNTYSLSSPRWGEDALKAELLEQEIEAERLKAESEQEYAAIAEQEGQDNADAARQHDEDAQKYIETLNEQREIYNEFFKENQEEGTTGSTESNDGVREGSEETSTNTGETDSTTEGSTDSALTLPAAHPGLVATKDRTKGNIPNADKRDDSKWRGYFKQGIKGTKNPMLLVKNLFGAIRQNKNILLPYVGVKSFSGTEVEFLEMVSGFIADWGPKVQANIEATDRTGFASQDMVHLFKDGMPSNWYGAIALAALQWIADNGNFDGYMTPDAMRKLLGLDSKAKLSDEQIKKLKHAGVLRDVAIQELGRIILNMLELGVYKDTPADVLIDMQMSLGNHAFMLLAQEGMLDQQRISLDELAKKPEDRASDSVGPNGDASDLVDEVSKSGSVFIRPRREGKGFSERVSQLAKTSRGNAHILRKAFGSIGERVDPKLEPTTTKQTSINNTSQGLPEVAQERRLTAAGYKMMMRKDISNLRDRIATDILELIHGVKDEHNGYVHSKLAESLRASNDALRRQIQDYADFRAYLKQQPDGVNTIFYLTPDGWKNQRFGYEENTVNVQMHKAQRDLVSAVGWQTTIDTTDPKLINGFMLSVAQGMGVDAEKLGVEAAIAEVQSLLTSSTATRAMDLLTRIRNEDSDALLTEPEQQLILAAVNLAKEPSGHVLDALINYSKYLEVYADEGSFTIDSMYEVDGKANGPTLSQIFMGVMTANKGMMSGFYPDFSTMTDHAQYLATGGLDIYDDMLRTIRTTLGIIDVPNDLKRQMVGVLSVLGNLKSRDMIKTPVMALIFGSSVKTILTGLESELEIRFYEQLQEAANGKDPQFELNQLIANMNTMYSRADKIPQANSIDEAMKITLSPAQVERMVKVFRLTVAPAIRAAAKSTFGDFSDVSGALNEAVNKNWSVYNSIRERAIAARLDEKMESGEIPFTEYGKPEKVKVKGKVVTQASKTDRVKVPDQYLSPADLEAIDKMLEPLRPIIQTAMSKESGDLSTGMFPGKRKPGLKKGKGSAFTANSKVTKPFMAPGKDGESKPTTGIISKGMVSQETAPGAAGVVSNVHGSDSAVNSDVWSRFESFNIHDAIAFSVKDMFEGATAMNEALFKRLMTYALPLEFAASTARVIAGFDRMQKTNPELITEENVAAINELRESYASTYQLALSAEISKLEFLLGTSVVNQYVMEGHGYVVTDTDKAELTKRIAQYKSQLTGSVKSESDPVVGKATVFGRQGPSSMPSERGLLSVLASKDNAPKTLKDISRVLKTSIASNSSTSLGYKKFLSVLLTQLENSSAKDTQIQLVTVDTKRVKGLGNGIKGARGAYHVNDEGVGTIYIKDASFVESGVTAELLLHELLHAAVAHAIRNNPNSPEVKELKELLRLTTAYIKDNKITGMDAAIANIDELVSWGMSNPEFSAVLSKVLMKSDSQDRASKSGLQKFIQTLKRIVFGNKVNTEGGMQIETGLSVLIANTGLLMEQSQNTKKQSNFSLTMQTIEGFDTEQVFTALANSNPTSAGFTEHLRNTLNSIVRVAYGPAGAIKATAVKTAQATAKDTYINALASGELPFTSKAVGAVKLSDQAAFVLESVEILVRDSLDDNKYVRNELVKVYRDTKAALKPQDFYEGDWSQATPDEVATAEKIYEFIFTAQESDSVSGRSAYLSQFAAMATAYEPLYLKLSGLKIKAADDVFKGKTISEALTMLINRLINTVSGWYSGTAGDKTQGEKLESIAKKLAKAEQRKKTKLMQQAPVWITAYEEGMLKLTDTVRKEVVKIAKKDVLDKSKYPVVRALSKAVDTYAGGRVEMVENMLKQARSNIKQEREGALAGLFTEIKGYANINITMVRLLRMGEKDQQNREKTETSVRNSIAAGFKNYKDMAKKESESVTQVFMRNDPAALLKSVEMPELLQLLRSKEERKNKIAELESRLTGINAQYYKNAAHYLGHFLATDDVKSAMHMQNAHNIAYMFGVLTDSDPAVDPAEAELNKPIIDQLASLHAMNETRPNTMAAALAVLERESQRGEKNGVEFVMLTHQMLQNDALENLFDGHPVHMMKGYTKEIFNSANQVKAVTKKQSLELLKAGWVKITDLEKDRHDNSSDKMVLMVLRDAAENTRTSGTISLVNKVFRGTEVTSAKHLVADAVEVTTTNKNEINKIIMGKKAKDIRALRYAKKVSPSTVPGSRVAPSLRPDGSIASWRYMMSAAVKDAALERDNRVDRVMGRMAGYASDKNNSLPQNIKVIAALKEQFDLDSTKGNKQFVEFGPNSPDATVRDTYKNLSDETRAEIKRVWKSNTMRVRSDLFDLTFGYTNYGVGDIFDKRDDAQNIVEKTIASIAKGLFKDQAQLKIRRIDQNWQMGVAHVKDFWVVKGLDTLLGNMKFNVGELMLIGVNPVDIVKHHVEAFFGLVSYQRDEREMRKLQLLVDSGYYGGEDAKAVSQRIIELSESMAGNPVKPLIDAGLYHTIAEEIDTSEDPHGYKNRIERFVAKKSEMLPGPVLQAAKWLYVSHDTELYQVLSQGVRMSDFLARYTAYKYVTEKKSERMTHVQAIEFADDAFVNYGIPTSRALESLNSRGFLMFTKYYVRMQRVLFRLFEQNPGRALGLNVLENMFSGAPDVTDPFFWNWLETNPVSAGALNLPGAIQEGLTIKALDTAF